MITKDSRVVATKKQLSTDLGGEIAILHLEGGIYYSLNEVGAKIWALIQEPRSVQEVLAIMLDEYEVAAEECERDLFAILEVLRDENLIQVENGSHT